MSAPASHEQAMRGEGIDSSSEEFNDSAEQGLDDTSLAGLDEPIPE